MCDCRWMLNLYITNRYDSLHCPVLHPLDPLGYPTDEHHHLTFRCGKWREPSAVFMVSLVHQYTAEKFSNTSTYLRGRRHQSLTLSCGKLSMDEVLSPWFQPFCRAQPVKGKDFCNSQEESLFTNSPM